MGQVARADGDADRAVNLLNEAERLYRPGFLPDVRPIAAIRARTWISQGKLAEAADWAQDRGVSATDVVSYLREFDHLTLVRLLLARHRADPGTGAIDQARDLLDRLRRAAEATGREGSLLEIRILQALVQDATGHRPQALDSLVEAFALAPEPDGYVRLFLDEGAPMLSLLRDARQHGLAGDHPRRLLNFGGAPAAEAPDSGAQQPRSSAESLSDRELQVLRFLDSELTGPEIARELFVSHNTLRTHTKHIFTKLDVTSRRAAVLRARECGWL
jgi:LuxR family maltose regulon positive regulatory protein